jgi:hypothetical protein
MSTDRTAPGRPPPVKPTLATRRTAGPLTPRVAGTPTPTTTAGRTPTIRANAPTATTRPRLPQVKVADTNTNNNNKDGDRNVHITPRSYVRTSRTESPSNIPPPHSSGISPNSIRGRPVVAASGSAKERTGNGLGLGIGAGAQSRPRVGQARSMVSDSGSSRGPTPLVRSPGYSDSGHSQVDGVDSRFFLASDATTRPEPVVRKPEPKRPSVFFHADGSSEAQLAVARGPPVTTPMKRYSNPWPQHDSDHDQVMSPPPLLSPALSSVSMSSSPFFAPLPSTSEPRAPSPSKENIHLSYRRGVSQIFGIRPSAIATSRTIPEQSSPNEQRRVSLEIKPYQTPHRKSTRAILSTRAGVRQPLWIQVQMHLHHSPKRLTSRTSRR